MRSFFKFMPVFIFNALLCCSCSQEESKPSSSVNTREHHLKIAALDDPLSLGPRIVRDLYSASIMRMLFEGLTRADNQGVIQPAIAKKIAVSDDLMTYTFTLRPSKWSDGTPLTAQDFVETWLSAFSRFSRTKRLSVLFDQGG